MWAPFQLSNFSKVKFTHVVAAEDGGSVSLPLKSEDGDAAITAACGKESMLGESIVTTWKGSSPANTRDRQSARTGIAVRYIMRA